MRVHTTSRISVLRGKATVPLYPAESIASGSDHPWPNLIGEQHRLHNMEIPEHEHEAFCFQLQTSGSPEFEWWWNGKNGVEAPKPGALMLLPPGTRDRVRWEGMSYRYVFALDANYVSNMADGIKPGFAPSFHTHWHFRDEPLRKLLAEIGREACEGWPLGALYADLLGLSLTSLLLRRYATERIAPPFARGGLPMRSLKISLEFITDNLHVDVRLADVASIVGLSPFHFARLFKAATGQSPYQYLLDQRLRRAKEFLRFGSLPIAEIAVQIGFSNHAYFSRAFRRREGVTPTAWRQSHQR